MASLPPYSTFRTDSNQVMFPQATSHGNILTFTPPGFTQQLNVKFPDSRLAVCAKCKKNFKTRDMCRVRNTHTSPPWTTAFICITIDESCLDESGRLNADKPMTVRMVQWQPYCIKKPFDSKTPVCSACKRTNRTRSFCRERHKHRQLPWCTVYVILSALDATDPTTVVAGSSVKVEADTEDDKDDTNNEDTTKNDKPVDEDKVNGKASHDSQEKLAKENEASSENLKISDTEEKSTPPKSPTLAEPPSSPKEEAKVKADDASAADGSDSGDLGDDIHDINESRTFLAKVSSRSTTIHWLELAAFDSSDVQGTAEDTQQQPMHGGAMMPMPPYMDPSQAGMQHQYYQPNMGYAAQQHQNALKSRQQYFFQIQQQQQSQQHHHPPLHSPYHHPPLPPWGPPVGNPYSPHHMGPPQQPPSHQPEGGGGEDGAGQQQQNLSPKEGGSGSDQQQQNLSQQQSHHHHMPPSPHGMHPPPPHWPMYYPHPPHGYPPPPDMPPYDMTNGQLGHHHPMAPHQYPGGPPPPGTMMPHHPGNPEGNAIEESDEQDMKRQRVT